LKKRYFILLGLVVLALVALPIVAGCGSSTSSTTASTASVTTASTASVTTAAPASSDTTAPASTETTAPASTETTAPAATTTSAAPVAAYDIKTVVAGIKADSALKSALPQKYQTNGINVASDIPYPPWEMFVGDTSQATGFDYDLSQALAAKLGIKANFIETKFDSIILTLQSGKNDVSMSDMYDNKERQKTLDFVDYAEDGTSILVLKGNPNKIVGTDTLAGKAVGCEKGTTQADFLTDLATKLKSEGKAEMTVMQYPDQPSALLAVQSGKVVGDLTDHSTASYVAQTQGDGNTFEVVTDPAAPQGYDSQPVGIGVLKTNTQLRDALQKALQALIDDGTYKTIVDHYGLIAVSSAQVNSGTLSGA
jgi:polar amino acid transport system substrate-binding protein